jgi:hypothetical protein
MPEWHFAPFDVTATRNHAELQFESIDTSPQAAELNETKEEATELKKS